MAVIAIDAGTSVIKAVAYDKSGREAATARETTSVLHPRPEFSEQSMEEVWRATQKALREVCHSVKEDVSALCITAQGDGCWLIDEQGEPTGNALLWNDGRAASIVDGWRESGAIASTQRVSGSATYPGLSNALLAWLHQNDATRVARSRWVLSCNGWLFLQLTGSIVADLSDASNPFGDVNARCYAEASFQAYDAAPFRRLFPDIAQGAALTRPLREDVAQRIGLNIGIPVTMAPYDIVSTAYGAGVFGPGQACVILGTTICAEAITHEADLASSAAGTTIALDGGLTLRAMPTLAGCETLEWAGRILGASDLTDLGEMARRSEPGAKGLFFLPYLSEAGERSPLLDPKACGSWHGLKLTHSREDMARAVYDGLSFVIRDCLIAAVDPVTELRVCGGGSRSDLWCQIIADVTNVTVLRCIDQEIGARGAFLYSSVQRGEQGSLRGAAAAFAMRFQRFEPVSGSVAIYRETYPHFLATREAMRPVWGSSAAHSRNAHD